MGISFSEPTPESHNSLVWTKLSDSLFTSSPSERDLLFRTQVLNLSKSPSTFSLPKNITFALNNEEYVPLAEKLLLLDSTLAEARHRMVPGRLKEKIFWRNYFYHLFNLARPKIQEELLHLEFGLERRVAIEAVLRAYQVYEAAYTSLVSGITSFKSDKDIALIADLSVRATLLSELKKNFPEAMFVSVCLCGEEVPGDELLQLAATFASSVFPASEALSANDLTSLVTTNKPVTTTRYWIVSGLEEEEIKGFAEGRGSVFGLALVVDSEVVLSVEVTPSLTPPTPLEEVVEQRQSPRVAHPAEPTTPKISRVTLPFAALPPLEQLLPPTDPTLQLKHMSSGFLLIAVKDQGATIRPLIACHEYITRVSNEKNFSRAIACANNKIGNESHDLIEVASGMGVKSVEYIENKIGYALVALGSVSVYIRLSSLGEETLASHAGGILLVREAGGRVTDLRGHDILIENPHTLTSSEGLLATNLYLHEETLLALSDIIFPMKTVYSIEAPCSSFDPVSLRRKLAHQLGIDEKRIIIDE